MPSITGSLASSLAESGGLDRAVETGTYLGDGARKLSEAYPEVVTIEVSPEFAGRAAAALADDPSITVLQGHSLEHLARLAAERKPTLFFLDGHWSGGETGGSEDECPVIGELEAIAAAAGDAPTAVVIDDARLFAAPPPPPHDPAKWPSLMELFEVSTRLWPGAYFTVLDDQVVIVDVSLRAAVEAYGTALHERQAAEVAAAAEGGRFGGIFGARRGS